MYRYLVFANDCFYPLHGMKGCRFKSNDIELVNDMCVELKEKYDLVQVFDVHSDSIIYEWEKEDSEDDDF